MNGYDVDEIARVIYKRQATTSDPKWDDLHPHRQMGFLGAAEDVVAILPPLAVPLSAQETQQ